MFGPVTAERPPAPATSYLMALSFLLLALIRGGLV